MPGGASGSDAAGIRATVSASGRSSKKATGCRDVCRSGPSARTSVTVDHSGELAARSRVGRSTRPAKPFPRAGSTASSPRSVIGSLNVMGSSGSGGGGAPGEAAAGNCGGGGGGAGGGIGTDIAGS